MQGTSVAEHNGGRSTWTAKRCAAIRTLQAEDVRYPLAGAVELLAPARVHLARRYLDLRRLRPDSKKAGASLPADVKAFEHASLADDSFESFEVNCKNFMAGRLERPRRPAD
jgi:hypothetical protein